MVSETLAETKAGWKIWNPEEQIAVAHKAVERMLALKCTKFPSYGAHSTTRCVDWAQRQVLPKARHRWISEFLHVQKAGIVPVMEERWKELTGEGALKAPPIPEKEDVPEEVKVEEPTQVSLPLHTRKARVCWTINETENVMALAVNRMKARGMGQIPMPGDRIGRAILIEEVRSAQNQLLPRERHRKLAGSALLNDRDELLLEKFMKNPREEPKIEAPPPPITITPTAEAVPRVELPPAPPIAPTETPGDTLTGFLSYLRNIETTVRETKELNQMLMEDIEKLNERISTLEKQRVTIPALPKEKLPTVALLGMRKDEFDIIKEACDSKNLALDLRLFEQDTKPRPVNCEWAVAMHFMSHAWNDQVKDSVPSGQYTFLRGGVWQVVQQLELWFNR